MPRLCSSLLLSLIASSARVVTAALLILLTPVLAFANPTHDKLMAKTEMDRADLFLDYLTHDGEPCGRVTKTFFQGMDANKTAYWNVACSDGSTYQVSIFRDPDGTTYIMACSELKEFANVECFKTFENQNKR